MSTDEIELTVHAYEWQIIAGSEPGVNDEIHAWCLDKSSVPHLLVFNDMPAFAYLELPLYILGKKVDWNQNRTNEIYNAIANLLGEDRPVSYFFVEKEKAYYYKLSQKFPFLVLFFPRMEAIRKLENRLKYEIYIQSYGRIPLHLLESDIDTIRKLLSTRDVKYSQ
jgi:hypothetical protein